MAAHGGGTKRNVEMEANMRSVAVGVLIVVGLVLASLVSFGTVTIITASGSVLSGTIESGLPNTLSLTSEDGDLFTVQKSNLKHIRFSTDNQVTVETLDGNILVGTLAGISDVLGLRTELGDVQSINVESVSEMRFEQDAPAPATVPVAAPAAPKPTVVTVPVGGAPLIDSVKAVYGDRAGSFTLGLDTGLQVGYSSKNGFGMPRFTIGVSGILMGPVWRTYFPPSAARVERAAQRLIDEGVTELEPLLEQTAGEVVSLIAPYVQLGLDALVFPSIGGGVMIRLSPIFYFDLGGSIDTFGLPWINFGLLVFL